MLSASLLAASNSGAGVFFVVVAMSPIDLVVAAARDGGWSYLLPLSSARNTFKRDDHAESSEIKLSSEFTHPDISLRTSLCFGYGVPSFSSSAIQTSLLFTTRSPEALKA